MNSSYSAFGNLWRPKIEAELDRLSRFPADAPATLVEATRYSLLVPGKRMRPLLTLMACDACGGTIESALPAACAAEMVHVFSLIHDDLPAMDDDDLRRGKPTNHKIFGEAQAILAGDALLALAFEVLAKEVRSADASVRCIRELAEASGPLGMAGGQSDDIKGLPADSGIDAIKKLHSRKTGALMVACLRMGAIIAGASSMQLDALTEYGKGIGVAFQITDDLLDVTGSSALLGKTAGKDRVQGKLTYPALLGIDASRKEAEQAIKAAINALDIFGKHAEHLRGLGQYIVDRRS